MTKQIFKAIFVVAISVLLASLALVMGVMFDYSTTLQREQMKLEVTLAAQGVYELGRDYFDNLNTGNYRLTWISEDGTVLYDTVSDELTMENHLDREEIQMAEKTGYGESSRYSSTLTEKLVYCAQRLPDGSFVRIAGEHDSALILFASSAKPLIAIILLAIFVSMFMAKHLSEKIVKPLDEINFDGELPENVYEEITPFVNKINNQQAQLVSDKEELERAAVMRQEFTANVSHELKTPLHAIRGYAELLKSGVAKTEDVKPFAEKIYAESIRMSNLVSDIIDLSQLDSGAKNMKAEITDLYLVAQNAVDSIVTVADTAGIELTLTGESAKINGIPRLLYGIVYNLCDNAIKYNHRDGKVFVSVKDCGETAVLEVEDTGIGITDEDKKRIFERFYRVDKSRSKAVGGTGLGLSIVKHSCLIHEAKIDVTSTENGTKFTVIFKKDKKFE